MRTPACLARWARWARRACSARTAPLVVPAPASKPGRIARLVLPTTFAVVTTVGAAPASAQAPVDMVLGRMVAARADAPTVGATTHARSRYVLHCAGCHGVDGAGSRLGHVPDLRQLGRFLRLDGGREFVIQVPGVMGSGLDDAQVAEVMNWVLATLARDSVPAGHRPFEAGEVARARATPLTDVAAARRVLEARARALGLSLDY